MLRISVKDGSVQTLRGNAKKTGKPYEMRKQICWVDLGKAFPVEVSVTLDSDQAPFPIGEYTLSKRCFFVSQFGDLKCDLRHMQPVSAAGVKVA
jgi:hypothetical protein